MRVTRSCPRRTATAILLAVGCAAAGCAPRRGAGAPPPLRVLVYNIHAGTDAAQAPALDRIAAVIREAGADIVLLQEVDSVVQRTGRVDQVAVLDSLTGLHGVFGRRRAGARVLLGGDLNATPESETQHRVRDAGWKDAWAVRGGAGDGFSYPDGVPRKRIDYLYLGAGERCRGAQVIETHASDHRPLLVLLER